jgi:hypothetical protein
MCGAALRSGIALGFVPLSAHFLLKRRTAERVVVRANVAALVG